MHTRAGGAGRSNVQWNVIIFRKRNIARDLPQVYYTSS